MVQNGVWYQSSWNREVQIISKINLIPKNEELLDFLKRSYKTNHSSMIGRKSSTSLALFRLMYKSIGSKFYTT